MINNILYLFVDTITYPCPKIKSIFKQQLGFRFHMMDIIYIIHSPIFVFIQTLYYIW